ncbi:MAG: hypothetical protein N2Z23_05200 [Pyrinomonadaceae bacterium]|nr:hypothetical protein [Pyrinomonadaceae bacterium]MCX7639822.1 hypothetical protein [Pyrinomonadaceae bacterium]MDW8305354.1 hypothetical protein [Acidobacteriota bacterium]
MKKTVIIILILFASFGSSLGQQTFNDENAPYTFEIPESTWRITVKPTEQNPTVEYVYGDRMDGLLEIRKLNTSPNEPISDIIAREQEQRLQFMPGYVAGREENFSGALKGKVFNFEFVRSGRTMSGRFYFLRADDTTVYVLRFTGERDKLRLIRNQLDIIARTFKIKS